MKLGSGTSITNTKATAPVGMNQSEDARNEARSPGFLFNSVSLVLIGWRMLSLSITAFHFFLSLVDHDENFGDGVVERAWDRVSDFDTLIESLRKRAVLHDGNAAIPRDFLDF